MKKHRLTALLLAMAMIVTYMPVIAFAAPEVKEVNSEKQEEQKAEKVLSAQEATGLPDTNADWVVNDDYKILSYGDKVKLQVELDGTEPEGEPVYEWYILNYSDMTYEIIKEDSFDIDGANCAFTVTDDTYLACVVTIGNEKAPGYYSVEIDNSDYGYKILYPDATAAYRHADNSKLKIDYINEEYFASDVCKNGDTVTIRNKGTEEVYRYDPDWENFINDKDEAVNLSWDIDTDVDAKNQKVTLHVYSDEEASHKDQCFYQKYDIYTTVDAEITSDIKSLEYEPSAFTVDSKDVAYTTEGGDTIYDLQYRCSCYDDEDGASRNTPFAESDKITVTYYDGERSVYSFDSNSGKFVNEDDDVEYERKYFWPDVSDSSLEPGNNTVKVWRHGVCTTIDVYMKDSAAEAKAKAEAEAKAKAAAEAAEAKAKATTTVTINSKTVNASTIAAAIKAAGGKTQYVNTFVIGKKVKKISAKAFKGTNVTTLTIKSKKLKKKSVKKALKGSKVKTVKVKVGNKKTNKRFVKKYKKIFTKKNAGKKVKIK